MGAIPSHKHFMVTLDWRSTSEAWGDWIIFPCFFPWHLCLVESRWCLNIIFFEMMISRWGQRKSLIVVFKHTVKRRMLYLNVHLIICNCSVFSVYLNIWLKNYSVLKRLILVELNKKLSKTWCFHDVRCCLVRISPSEGDSVGSDPGSERASHEDGTNPAGLPSDTKQTRKAAVNGLNGKTVWVS